MLSRPFGFSLSRVFFSAIFSLALVSYGHSQNLSGTVTNGTSEKPAAGADVTLIKLANGMEEAGTTKTDSKGKFSFKLDDAGGPHLVRATFQGTQYFKMAPPGTTTADLTVYDSAKKVEGMNYTVDALRLEVSDNQVHATRTFAINNQSKPPKTQSDGTFQFYLPDGAVIDSAMALGPGGRSVRTSTTQQSERNLYAVEFPLRPGETKMQIAFHMPYSGSLDMAPKSKYQLEHFVVMLPKAMTFEAKSTSFQTVKEGPGAGAANVQVVTNVQPGQSMAFKISGTGTLPPEADTAGSGAAEGGGPNNGGPSGEGLTSRPGGGLGPPSDAPDPLQNFRWWILGAFALVLAGGGYYVTQRNKNAPAMAAASGGAVSVPLTQSYSAPSPVTRASEPAPYRAPAVTSPAPAMAVSSAPSSASVLMQAMKEELFQLEIDRHQGTISPEEYQSTKAALDQTLARAMQREARRT
jgi:5-hydroxyisourate hydrolase-like protein (transthyretin family)